MKLFIYSLLAFLSAFSNTCLAQSKTPFDSTKYMRVSEVREGMKGYGLSVFKGTKIERFEVEVLSVLRNFNPQRDVVLVRMAGANLEHTGSIAGMSGSPIYLKDDTGKERMVGAFAYGWPLMKDPVGGVQPIEYMLQLESKPPSQPATANSTPEPSNKIAGESPNNQNAQPRAHWSLSDVVMLPGMKQPPRHYPFAQFNSLKPNPNLGALDADTTRLRPLATPLMASGLSPTLIDQFGPILSAYNLVPLQAGSSGKGDTKEPAPLAPGSVIAIPLLSGDMDLTAVGTCTEVVGDKVWGFGHSFNNEGPITMPMGSGEINAVIANLSTSFKLGTFTKARGALTVDEIVGIAGKMGAVPATVPIELHVLYTDGSLSRNYNFQAAVHPRLTSVICSIATISALSGSRDLPQYHTLDYDLKLEFQNGQFVRINNTAVNTSASELFFSLGAPIIAASDNPFERVIIKKITGELRVTPEAREARILSVNVPRTKFRPGETVKAYVTYRPFRAGEAILPVDLELPRDLDEGDYQLAISDWRKYLEEEQNARPFRFTAENADQVFSVLKDVASIKRNALYLRLTRKEDGVAIGRSALPHLPSSRRQVLLDAGRSNTTSFVSTTTKIVPTALVMEGQAEFVITIDNEARVETVAAAPTPEGKPDKQEKPSKQEKTESAPKPNQPTQSNQ